MSLPIVIIFERHWDPIPKTLLRDLLPDLKKRGYETICYEAPENISSAEIVDRHRYSVTLDQEIQKQAEDLLKQRGITQRLSEISFGRLAELLKSFVLSNHCLHVAEKIKTLPALLILNEVFDHAAELSLTVKGIDIDSEIFDQMGTLDSSSRMSILRTKNAYRDRLFFQNLCALRTQQEGGLVFACGALHAKGLIDQFKQNGLENEVLYYFPHSSSRYDESVDDVNHFAMNVTLLNHTYLLSQKDLKPFGERVIREISEKTTYRVEIPEHNAHARFLTDYFKTPFQVLLRPGSHADALVDTSGEVDVEDIKKRVQAVGVQTQEHTLDGRRYLVIPHVNTIEIAERIRKIPANA